jgi:Fe-S-cluster-containing dehydrogenase component
VLACPFGIPKIFPEREQMMKCDMCYDRTSIGKRPMCATVCPSQALSYVRPEQMTQRREKPTNVFYFGKQRIVTKVRMMVPLSTDSVSLDVLDHIWEESHAVLPQA